MKTLHILKSEPDANTTAFLEALCRDVEVTVVRLYEGEPDYEALVDAIFAHDKTITWW